MKYVKFTENNDWEGETWHFWLPLEGNEAEMKELYTLVNTFFNMGGDDSFEMDYDNPVDETEVDAVVKHSGSGYYNYHNKVTGKMKMPEFKDQEDAVDKLYKGGVKDLFS